MKSLGKFFNYSELWFSHFWNKDVSNKGHCHGLNVFLQSLWVGSLIPKFPLGCGGLWEVIRLDEVMRQGLHCGEKTWVHYEKRPEWVVSVLLPCHVGTSTMQQESPRQMCPLVLGLLRLQNYEKCICFLYKLTSLKYSIEATQNVLR
jgi:hypothetical protein